MWFQFDDDCFSITLVYSYTQKEEERCCILPSDKPLDSSPGHVPRSDLATKHGQSDSVFPASAALDFYGRQPCTPS